MSCPFTSLSAKSAEITLKLSSRLEEKKVLPVHLAGVTVYRNFFLPSALEAEAAVSALHLKLVRLVRRKHVTHVSRKSLLPLYCQLFLVKQTG